MPALANAMRYKSTFAAMAPSGTFAQPATAGATIQDMQGGNAPGAGTPPNSDATAPTAPQKTPQGAAPAKPMTGVQATAPGVIADPFGPPKRPDIPTLGVVGRPAQGEY